MSGEGGPGTSRPLPGNYLAYGAQTRQISLVHTGFQDPFRRHRCLQGQQGAGERRSEQALEGGQTRGPAGNTQGARRTDLQG